MKRPLWWWWVCMELLVVLFSISLGYFIHDVLELCFEPPYPSEWIPLLSVTSLEIPSFIFQILQTPFYPCGFLESVKFENWSLRFWDVLCEDNSPSFGINVSLFVSFSLLAKTLFNSISSKFGFIANLCDQRSFGVVLKAWRIHLFQLVMKV